MSLPILSPLEFYKTDTVPYSKVGQIYRDGNGNSFRYVKNGLVAQVAANLLQEPVEDAQFVSLAVPTAIAAGATVITVTNGTTTVTAGQFNNGRLTVSTSTGIGQSFNIVSHTIGVSGAAISFTVDRPLLVALATSSKVSVRVNPYNGVIQYPVTTQTGAATGFALTAVAASTATVPVYGYIQSGGDTAVLFDTGANSANGASGIAPSAAVAGSVKQSDGTAGDIYLGYSRQVASVDATVSIAHIVID